MTFKRLKHLFARNKGKQFKIQLPNRKLVPAEFHITEVGQVDKSFIDCGGKVRTQSTALLQVWLGSDEDHRLSTEKMAKILSLSSSVVRADNIPVEVEYEDTVISQYPVKASKVTEGAVILELGAKHTDCLAKESCGSEECNGHCCRRGGVGHPPKRAARGEGSGTRIRT